MTRAEMVQALDDEIARLEKAKALLTNVIAFPRPKTHKRVLSAEARKRIGDAQRRRWAKQKRAA